MNLNVTWIPRKRCIRVISFVRQITPQEAEALWIKHANAYEFIDKMPSTHLDAITRLGDFISNIDYGKEK